MKSINIPSIENTSFLALYSRYYSRFIKYLQAFILQRLKESQFSEILRSVT